MVHHEDYLNRRHDQALCGIAFEKPAPAIRPVAVCPDCEAKLAEYHLKWWREKAEEATAELDGLRAKYRELAEYVDSQRRQVAGLHHLAPVRGDPSGQQPESHRGVDSGPQAGSTGAGKVPSIAVVLGSGLGGFADRVHDEISLPYEELPYWPAPRRLMRRTPGTLNSAVPISSLRPSAN